MIIGNNNAGCIQSLYRRQIQITPLRAEKPHGIAFFWIPRRIQQGFGIQLFMHESCHIRCFACGSNISCFIQKQNPRNVAVLHTGMQKIRTDRPCGFLQSVRRLVCAFHNPHQALGFIRKPNAAIAVTLLLHIIDRIHHGALCSSDILIYGKQKYAAQKQNTQ